MDTSDVPQVVNITAYRGDPYYLKVPFENEDGTAMDVSDPAIVFTASISDTTVSWAVDTSNAADGYIILGLTGAQTKTMRGQSRWDFACSLWRKTLAAGELRLRDRADTSVVVS